MPEITAMRIPDVLLLRPERISDHRGFFCETWNNQGLQEHGLTIQFAQDNLSYTKKQGTLRGLHYQAPPDAQGKLVTCLSGRIWDIAVDARRGSPSFGQWVGAELSLENGLQMWVPKGFLHGFITLTDACLVSYKCSDHYAPKSAGAVRWDSLGIDWKTGTAPILSEKDRTAPVFSEWETPFLYNTAS